MEDYSRMLPKDFRRLVREGKYDSLTCGQCCGYVQANLVILEGKYAEDFHLFAARNARACPVLEVTEPGCHYTSFAADHADLLTDVPMYNIYRNGVLTEQCTDVSAYWKDDMVCFLLKSRSVSQVFKLLAKHYLSCQVNDRNTCDLADIRNSS